MATRRAASASEPSRPKAASEPVLDLLDNIPLREFTPKQMLNRLLSTKSSLSSSQTVRDQCPHNAAIAKNIRHIGEGQCGTVYSIAAPHNLQFAIKIAKTDKAEQLWQDYITHRDVEEIWASLPMSQRPDINIPQTVGWIQPACDEFWADYEHDDSSPPGFSRNYSLVSERIYPLPDPLREAVFKYFGPPQYKSETSRTAQLEEDKNKDCLVRIYLGRRTARNPSKNFKLRNFDLMINEMEDLQLDPGPFATTMAKTLAMLHWAVGVDANDVEFVLGMAPEVRQQPSRSELRDMGPDDPWFREFVIDFRRRRIGVWLLDFNQCATFKHDEAGLKQLVDGFWRNDPYYPRPGSRHKRDRRLWKVFKEVYLTAGEQYIHGISGGLAGQFVAEVEKRSDKQSQGLFG